MDRISGLDQLYDASYRRLVVQMYAVCGDLAEAEDAVQEAFVVAVRKERQLETSRIPRAGCERQRSTGCRSGWRHVAVVRKYQPGFPVRRARSRWGRITWPS